MHSAPVSPALTNEARVALGRRGQLLSRITLGYSSLEFFALRCKQAFVRGSQPSY